MRGASESATVTAMLGASRSSSNLSTGPRKVRLTDRELLQRVQRVAVPNAPVDLPSLTSQGDWKRVRAGVTGGMRMYSRELRATTPSQTHQQCQVVVRGEIRAPVSELRSMLRAPTESESNALLRALYGSRFIYSSLVHAAAFSERGSPASPLSRGSVVVPTPTDQQLMVRTASFGHTGFNSPFKRRSTTTADSLNLFRPQEASGTKNDQICYVELLAPTQEGFRLVFCSLDATDVTTGKAPPERVTSLHPLSGWLTVEPTPNNPDALRLTFQAQFLGSEPGGCGFQVAQARLLFIAKGICRLGKVLRRRERQRRQQYTAPGRVWQRILKPFHAAFGLSDHETSGGTPNNGRCIACTRSFRPLIKRWQRCDLCAYRICAELPCCSLERVAIYNRYVVTLSVCARCRECIDERDSDHRGSVHRVGGLPGDVRYAGLSLRSTDQRSELNPELEVDPSILSYDRVRMAEALSSVRRQRERPQVKRRTQSDPSL
ncbi:hypothetical protein PHYPSEUDO_008808 [Phytophthora pseudosyringae]|uniref:FYVE-type domain-containing protein n=1 Tax=Phytophthora pseudosyringae TaxID=221518 RepID=A0A8T1W9X6_9STRA|nr:hypothetical protein PHYPSEUDO_008808 [Phytophthora pseudosyringae]